jgi:phosphoribosylformylglycinamidine cyclo-ligase
VRVAEYSKILARALGLSERAVQDLEYGALLHDLGKVGRQYQYILQKPGRLSLEEQATMRAHPHEGAEIVAKVRALRGAAEIVRNHHERPDGLGYPAGLRGDDIPIGSRIVMVADAYDAMTSDRPYRRAMEPARAVAELARGARPAARPPRHLMRYRDAGVDIARADATLRGLREVVRSTFTPHVVGDVGHFAGLCALPGAGPDAPLLAASTDGVGTKILIARDTGRHAGVAGDLVRHCVNDILVLGARPLFFLDYFACGALAPEVLEQTVRGIAEACRDDGVALLGGETAEMPDLYAPGDYDLAGTIVGFVDRARVIDGRSIRAGDVLLALPSLGLHTNGYALARRIVAARGLAWEAPLPGAGGAVADLLLAPHRSYRAPLWPLLEQGLLAGLAHVTGGGIAGNLVRVLPAGVRARVERASWAWPPLFRALAELGEVPREEMEKVMNLGVGMILVVHPEHAGAVRANLESRGESPWQLGAIEAGEGGVELV